MLLKDKQQSFCKLMSDSFSAFKPLAGKLFFIYIIQCIVTYGLIGTLAYFLIGDSASHIFSITEVTSTAKVQETIATGDTGPNINSLAGLGLLFFVLWGYFTTVIFNRADGMLTNDDAKIQGCWKAGWKRLLPILGYAVMMAIILGAVALATVLLTMLLATISKWAVGALLIVAFIVFTFFAIRLSLGYALVASRQKGTLSGISASFRLTKGYIWRLIGMYVIVVFVPGIAFFLLTSLVNLIVPAGTAGFITNIIIQFIQNFVIVVLTVGATYVFINDCLHHHGENK